MLFFEFDQATLTKANPDIDPATLQLLGRTVREIIPILDASTNQYSGADSSDLKLGSTWIERASIYTVEATGDELENDEILPSVDGVNLNIFLELGTRDKINGDSEYASISLNSDAKLTLELPAIEDSTSKSEALDTLLDELSITLSAMRHSIQRKQEIHDTARAIILNNSDVVSPGEVTPSNTVDVRKLLPAEDQAVVADLLESLGLQPQIKQKIGETTSCYFSPVFTKGKKKRPHVIMYVETPQGIRPQIGYMSKSQATWRLLPGRDPHTGWYCKGQDEQALTFPAVVQDTLRNLSTGRPMTITKADLDGLVGSSGLVPPISVRDKDSWPLAAGHFNELPFDPDAVPDFELSVASEEYDAPLYGQVYTKSFLSTTGEYVYKFAHDTEGRAWVMSIQPVSAPLRQNGLVYDSFVKIPAPLNQPAYEYKSQKPFNVMCPSHPTDLSYVDIFTHGLSDNPLLKAYYRTIDREHLPFMSDLPADIIPATSMRAMQETIHKLADAKPNEYRVALYRLLNEIDTFDSEYREHMFKQLSDITHEMEVRSESAETAMETTWVPPMKPIENGSDEAYRLDLSLSTMQFERMSVKAEQYDEAVTYEYWQSALFPQRQLILTKKEDTVILINAIVTN